MLLRTFNCCHLDRYNITIDLLTKSLCIEIVDFIVQSDLSLLCRVHNAFGHKLKL